MRLRLSPRDDSFSTLFGASAAHLVVGADLLAELLATSPADRPEVAERMRAAEHAADETTHEIMRKLNSTFVTPFDRQDIYALASGLDDVMDAMEAAVDIVVLYQVGELPSELADMVGVLQKAAAITAEAMPGLRSIGPHLADYWIEVNRLENLADQVYRGFIARLFGGDTDAVTIMKLKDVVTELEDAADKFEQVANIVETIAVKES